MELKLRRKEWLIGATRKCKMSGAKENLSEAKVPSSIGGMRMARRFTGTHTERKALWVGVFIISRPKKKEGIF